MIYERLDELNAFIAAGMCTRRRHPELPLWIHNYSQKAQFEFTAETWPEALRDARGLVLVSAPAPSPDAHVDGDLDLDLDLDDVVGVGLTGEEAFS